MAIEYPIHLCPVCGMPAENTGRICYKHYQVTYDKDGNVVSYKDIPVNIPMCKWYTTTEYPTFKPKCQRYYWIPPAGFFLPLFVWVGILAVWFECLL